MSTPELDTVWSWRYLDVERARALWDELFDWVDWLRRRYQFAPGQVPDCWYRHGAAVEELTALMSSHKSVYTPGRETDAYTNELTDWHTLRMRPVLTRLREGFEECDASHCRHNPSDPRTYPGVDDFVAQDLAVRPDRPAQVTPPASVSMAKTDARVLPADAMAKAVRTGLAEPIDPADPECDVIYEDGTWVWDDALNGYRASDDA